MAWGFNPYLSENEPVLRRLPCRRREPCRKLVATGFKREDAYLTFQEYFEQPARPTPSVGASPRLSLLGALMAQVDFGVGSIGGKDSMSGSFEDLDVPPTLVSASPPPLARSTA